MTNELWAALIGAVVLLLTNTAAAVKLWSEVQKTKADRASTKESRDKDSQDLHDQCMKNSWEISGIKDTLKLHSDRLLDSEQQITIVVKEMAIISTKLDNLIELVKGSRHDSATPGS